MNAGHALCILAATVAGAVTGVAVLIRRALHQRKLREQRRHVWAREQELVALTVDTLYLQHGDEGVWDDFVAGHSKPRPDMQGGA